jgi:hypothetical protein
LVRGVCVDPPVGPESIRYCCNASSLAQGTPGDTIIIVTSSLHNSWEMGWAINSITTGQVAVVTRGSKRINATDVNLGEDTLNPKPWTPNPEP